MSNSGTTIVSLHQETKVTNEAISNTSDDYKIQGIPLPSQQSTFFHAQWMPPWPLTPHTMSWPSTEGNSSWKSTTTFQISSTTSHISDSMLPPHSCQVHFTPTKMRERQSLRFSKKNTSASRPSSSLSTAST